MTEEDRFWSKVDLSGDCWLWTGAKRENHNSGKYYGAFRFSVFGYSTGAHRVSFYLATGIKSTRENPVDHICNNTLCVKPEHLRILTNKKNILRGTGPTAVNAAKTHCIHGHELTPENVQTWKNSRFCKRCHADVTLRRYYERKVERDESLVI